MPARSCEYDEQYQRRWTAAMREQEVIDEPELLEAEEGAELPKKRRSGKFRKQSDS